MCSHLAASSSASVKVMPDVVVMSSNIWSKHPLLVVMGDGEASGDAFVANDDGFVDVDEEDDDGDGADVGP